ncbi:MAG: hypothetical protein ACLGIN_01085 [Candidatus Sericytochromatia bacterium]
MQRVGCPTCCYVVSVEGTETRCPRCMTVVRAVMACSKATTACGGCPSNTSS